MKSMLLGTTAILASFATTQSWAAADQPIVPQPGGVKMIASASLPPIVEPARAHNAPCGQTSDAAWIGTQAMLSKVPGGNLVNLYSQIDPEVRKNLSARLGINDGRSSCALLELIVPADQLPYMGRPVVCAVGTAVSDGQQHGHCFGGASQEIDLGFSAITELSMVKLPNGDLRVRAFVKNWSDHWGRNVTLEIPISS